MSVSRKVRSVCAVIVVMFLAMTAILATSNPTFAQGTAKTIKYGDVVKGKIGATKGNNFLLYRFNGKAGDVISILMIRSSGNLKPFFALTDPTLPRDEIILAQSKTAVTGTIAGLSKFEIPATKAYLIVATHEGFDSGNTSGDFSLFLVKGNAVDLTLTPAATPRRAPTRTPVGTRRAPTRTPIPDNEPIVEPDEPTAEPDQPTAEPDQPTETPIGPDNTAGKATQTFEVGKSPVFSVWSGEMLYVSNFGDGTVSVLDIDGNPAGVLKAGGGPFALAWDGARVWVADYGTADKPGTSVTLFDGKTNKKVATFKVGKEPFSMSYDAEAKRMWIALYGDNKVISVDPKGKILSTVETDTNPNTVLWTGEKLWVTLAGNADSVGSSVLAIDGDSNIIDTIKVGNNPADLAWNDVDQVLYVANYDDNSITTLDNEGKVLGTFVVGKSPGALTWDGERLWVSLGEEKAIVALNKKGKQLARIPVSVAPNGISNDGTHVWVANQGTDDKPGFFVTRIDMAAAVGGKQ